MLSEAYSSASRCAAWQEIEICSAEEEEGLGAPGQHTTTPAEATAQHTSCTCQRIWELSGFILDLETVYTH